MGKKKGGNRNQDASTSQQNQRQNQPQSGGQSSQRQQNQPQGGGQSSQKQQNQPQGGQSSQRQNQPQGGQNQRQQQQQQQQQQQPQQPQQQQPGTSKDVSSQQQGSTTTSIQQGSSRTSPPARISPTGGNGGAAAIQDVRGGLRGRRTNISDYSVISRPKTLQTKQGTMGKKVVLKANYFRVSETYAKGLNQYHVDFSPELETKYRKQIIAKNKEKFGGYIFDGTKLYTKCSFNDFEFKTKSDVCQDLIKVSLKFVGAIHLHDAEWLSLCNIIVRRCMDGLQLQLIGRNLFNALSKIQLRDFNLEIWPGYITSFRQHEKDLFLCCDIIHKVMRHETVLHILRRLLDQSVKTRCDFAILAKNELLGSIVLTDYNNKTYRIDDIDFESDPRTLFHTNNGNISFLDYYKKRYNITITDPKQPLLITKPLEKMKRSNLSKEQPLIKLVPELCRATGITDAMKSNRKLMTEMAAHTRVNPEQRIQRLLSFQKTLYTKKESSNILNEFNLKIDSDLVEIPGRVLPEPVIIFGGEKKVTFHEWEQCFKSNTLLQGNQLTRWCVVIPGENFVVDAKNFVKCCQDTGRRMGFQIREPEFIVLPMESNMAYSKVLEQACMKDPQLIMAFINSPRADLYSCIKKKLTCDRAVPSQCVKIFTVKRPSGLLSVATKVCVQMNAKLRCAPWSVQMPDNVMCIGFDVCHSTKDRNKSYGALVASMDVNKKPGVYFSALSEHVKGNEMSNDIALNVLKALRQYKAEHQKLPTFIFFYRDGVGDGQLHQVYEHEVNNVIKAVEGIYASANLTFKMAYIIVSKRINTRIFTSNGMKGNPEPGTIVDDIITLPQRYDFFLISQSVRQGTVSPTSYNVLWDNTRLAPDRLQDMTYRQTHMYYNYFATVRVPAVCQYAHKLAFLVGQYLHQAPNNLLEKNLYYL